MPRVEMVRFTVTKAGSERPETWNAEAGISYREVLTEELCVNPAKFTLYVNGAPANLNGTLADGDSLDLQPKNYSSGC